VDEKNLLSSFSRNERISMIDFDRRELPVSVQAGMLGINRTSLYYKSSGSRRN
jgi:putative transposase